MYVCMYILDFEVNVERAWKTWIQLRLRKRKATFQILESENSELSKNLILVVAC